jgi:hypothetical protein
MEKQRNLLELWLIVEKRFNENFKSFNETTLCGCLVKIRNLKLINEEEYNILIEEMYVYGKRIGKNPHSQPFWKIGNDKPRKTFIQKQILKAIKTT